MILSKDQINRYLRHIIMPEISGAGQRKIIGSRVFIYSSSVNQASSLIFYLAASGVGKIFCHLNDSSGFEDLCSKVHDLNGDVVIEFYDNEIPASYSNLPDNEDSAIRILIDKYDNLLDSSINSESSVFIPTIVAVNNGWKGLLQAFNNQDDLMCFFIDQLNSSSIEYAYKEEGFILSANLLGVFTAIECIKLCLDAGTIFDSPLSFDLLSMQFNQLGGRNPSLNIADFIRKIYPNDQTPAGREKAYITKKLSESKVLIVGTGGLGSPNVYALTSIGVGTLGLVDYDRVELSNLNRQIIHSTSRIEMSKVESAKIFVSSLNPDTKVITYNTSLNIDNVKDIIKDYDVIVDALDNFPDRYLLNDACFFAGKPLVDAAAVKTHGLIMTILPKKGPCYRCAFPSLVKPNGVMSCAESGVLGPVPGAMGFIQAAEVVKLLLGIGDLLSDRVIYYEALDSDFETISIDKSEDCELCGTHPSITALVEYKNSCEVAK